MSTLEIMQRARSLSAQAAQLTREQRDRGLECMALALRRRCGAILSANARDVAENGEKLGAVMCDRLALSEQRVSAMAQGLSEIATLPDPLGVALERRPLANGLLLEKQPVPLGVVAIIFESRPNVAADAAGLCLKSGNCCILRGGREAAASCALVVGALREGLSDAGLEPDFIQLVDDPTRAGAAELMAGVGYIDLLIPRGGAGLIRACRENAKVPCIATGTGICHIYVDAAADIAMALDIVDNAKTSRPSVCNAAEVCLVERTIAAEFLPLLRERLVTQRAAAGLTAVELRLDERAAAIIPGTSAGDADFDTEFLDYILAVAVVDGVSAACAHIAAHSTGHSEAIVTADAAAADYFTAHVDSAAVYVNASTRFTDGGEFGLGCEMGISTQKLHARGPMGLHELTSYKYIVRGSGQIR